MVEMKCCSHISGLLRVFVGRNCLQPGRRDHLAERGKIHRIESLIEPVRMFSAIFFVTIGLLLDPEVLAAYWLPVLVITLAVVVGKWLLAVGRSWKRK